MSDVDLSEYTWLKRDPSPIVKKSGMFVAPQKVSDLVKPEESFIRALFFDWLGAQYDSDTTEEFSRALAMTRGAKAPKDWNETKRKDAVARLELKYDQFKQAAVTPLVKAIRQAKEKDPSLANVRTAMVERTMDEAGEKGLPVWFEAAKGLAASRAWKTAVAETVHQFGVISTALGKGGKPSAEVEKAIDKIGVAFRDFAPKEGKLREAINRLVQLSTQGAGMEVEGATRAVIEAGMAAASSTEEFANAVSEAAGEIGKFMTNEAKKIYKENLATVAPEVSTALLATKEVTFLATTSLGIAAAAFWPLAPVALALGIISTVCQKVALSVAAKEAVADEDTMLMLLSTRFGESDLEEAEKKFDKLETTVDIIEKAHNVLEITSHVSEKAKELLEPAEKGLETFGHVLSPIGVTVGGASLVFAFAKGDPQGMEGKWDGKTEEKFKSAAAGCLDRINKKIDSAVGQDCEIEGWAGDHFDVTLLGVQGRLYPDGRFEPKNHDFALEEATKQAKKRGETEIEIPVLDRPDGRQYGPGVAHLDLASVSDVTWDHVHASLTLTTPARITLHRFEGFTWTENWKIVLYLDGDVALPPGEAGNRLTQMPYMPLAEYHLKGHGRDIMKEKLDFNDYSTHPFGRWVTNEEPPLGVTKTMRVKSDCPPEEKAAVIQWLQDSGTAEAWSDTYEKSNSYTNQQN